MSDGVERVLAPYIPQVLRRSGPECTAYDDDWLSRWLSDMNEDLGLENMRSPHGSRGSFDLSAFDLSAVLEEDEGLQSGTSTIDLDSEIRKSEIEGRSSQDVSDVVEFVAQLWRSDHTG